MARDQRVEMILARRADVFRALAARRRLLASWVLLAGLCVVVVVKFDAGLPLVAATGACFFWSAVELALLQRALREPASVVVATFIGALFPPAAPILAIGMYWESVAVLKIARRLRAAQCVRCGYDLRGITSLVCPECGWETQRIGEPDGPIE